MNMEITLSSFCYCRWFGNHIKMKVIDFDNKTNKYQVRHLNAYGSFWTKLEKKGNKIIEVSGTIIDP